MGGSRARRAAAWALTAGLLLAAAVTLRARWREVEAVGGLPGLLPFGAAVAANVAANLVVVAAWRGVLAAAGSALGARAAAWVWAVSQLARYTVGAAQVAGRAVAGRRYGLSATAGAVSAVVEVVWQTCLSATLVLATMPWWLPGAGELTWLAVVGALPAAALAAGLAHPAGLLRTADRALGWRPVARVTGGRLRGVAGRVDLDRGGAARLTLLYALNTALRLGAFLALLSALGGDLGTDGLRAVGAYALGQLLGRLAVFAPGGLGPREGATALAVLPAVGPAPAIVLVAAVRLAEIVAEGVFLAAARAARPGRPLQRRHG